ncbi:hypothetical protein J6590_097712 [Homalodisca vitripennis]|nr:hypothetical protein J6590_097712 [Homalodisca vitripennis]
MNDEAFDSDLDSDDMLLNNIGEDSDDDHETGMEVDTTHVSPFSEDPQPSTSTAPAAMRDSVTVPRPDSGATPQCDCLIRLKFLNENSPPPSENGSPLPAEPPKADGRGSSGRKRMKRNKTKCYRDLEELKLKYKKSTQKAERYKKRYLRLLKSTEMGNTVSTPRTKVKQLLKGQAISAVVRKKLVFGELLEQEVSKTYRNTANTREKHLIRNMFNPDNLRKYKVKKSVERLVGINKAKYNKNYKTLQ